MIRYLQKLRAGKGFTMAELIVVIAIVAVLLAMILPAFSSDDAEKQAAETYASDFYASLQYNMTRYQKTEYHLTPQLQTKASTYKAGDLEPYILYNKERGGNIFTREYLYIEVVYDKGIQQVKISDTLAGLVAPATPTDTPFGNLLKNDLENIMNAASEGYYYAVVQYDYDPTNLSGNVGYGDLRVITAHYCDKQLPSTLSGTTDITFTDFGELEYGAICGTCSSDKYGDLYIGAPTTIFLNVSHIASNTINE